MSRNKGGKEAVKDEIKQVSRNQVKRGVKDDSKPEATEEAKAEVTEGVNGSADGSNELPIEIASINQPSNTLPAIPFQPETLLPANLPPELEPGWVAPINWGLEEWVERAEKLGYWADGIGRLDALVTKRHGESLWHVWDWFRRRKEQIKAEGKKLKDEPLTWTGLCKKKNWDRATVSRKIEFFWEHRNTPDDQLDGKTICSMWHADAGYMKDPLALGQFFRLGRSCREVISDELGKNFNTQVLLEEGTVIEVAGFNDGAYHDTVMRIKSGKHAGKCFNTLGVWSNPVDPAQVPDLIKAIEDARKTKPKKPKRKKSKSEGIIAGSLPPADAPVWVFKGDTQFRVQKVVIKDGRWALLNEPVTLYLLERVKIVTEVKDQTILQVVVPHGFDFFRVASNKRTSLFSRESDLQQEQPTQPPTEKANDQGDQIDQTTTPTPVEQQPPLSEDFKEGLAQVEFSEVAKTLLAKIWAVSEYLDSLDPNDVEQQLNKAEQFAVSKVVDQMRVRINDHVEVLDDDDEVEDEEDEELVGGLNYRARLDSTLPNRAFPSRPPYMNEEDQALYNRYLGAMAAAKAKPKKVSIPSAAPDDTEEREEREQMEALMKRRAAAALEDDDIAPPGSST